MLAGQGPRSCKVYTSGYQRPPRERSDVRGALIGTQTELAETQAELDAWTHELDSFQQVGMALSKLPGIM